MAFPADLLDVRAALYYSGAWNYITGDVRGITADSGGGVKVVRGRSDESGRVTPTRCDLVLSSPNGEYNPRVPTSSLYGLIGRNTPLQVSVGEPHVGAADTSDSGSTSHVAPTVTAASAGLLVCAWAGSAVANYTAPGSMTEQAETDGSATTMSTATETVTAGATGTRTATSSVSTTHASASAVLHGSSIAVEETVSDVGTSALTLTTGAGTTAGWWLVAVHYWEWDDGSETRGMPAAPASGEGGWILLADSGDRVVSSSGDRMKVWARRVERSGAQSETFDAMDGDASINAHAHLLVLSGVDDWSIRATVEVPSWPQRWDPSGNDGWVPVAGAGVLRRLGGQGREQLRSPIYRAVTGKRDMTLLAYWPCEDGSDADRFVSAVNGHPAGFPVRAADARSRDGTLPGSAPLVAASGDGTELVFNLHNYADNDQFRVECFYRVTAFTSGSTNLVAVAASGTGALWRVDLGLSGGSGEISVSVEDEASSPLDSDSVTGDDMFDEWVHVMLAASHSGGTVSWRMKYQQLGGSVVTLTGSFSGTSVGRVSQVATTIATSVGGTNVDYGFGHVSVWDDDDNPATVAHWVADDGHANELAGDRIVRLCAEESIALAFVGDPVDTLPMGAQSTDTLLGVLRECETVDLGVLHEPREMLGLAYRTRASLYNQTALLALTYGADGEVVPPLHPEPDDLLTANDVTATRVGGSGRGSSVRAVQVSGPLAVETIGTYPGSADVNVASPLDLANQALWRLHLGTVDEDRFPVVSVNLAALGNAGKTALLTSAQVLDIGDRLTIDTPPDRLPPDDIDQLVQGYREEFGQFEWRMELNCSPASPWQVGVYADDAETPGPAEPKRYSPYNSQVNTSFAAGTDTSLVVEDQTGGNDLWSTSADLPFDILVRGVRLRVTAIGAATGAVQTLTVDQTPINGVTGVTVAVGERVELWAPAVYAL